MHVKPIVDEATRTRDRSKQTWIKTIEKDTLVVNIT